MDKLKKSLMEHIKSCEDEKFLAEVFLMFENKGGVNEPEIVYHTNEDYQVPEEHYKLLEEDMEKLKRGELKTYTCEEVKENVRKKLDELQTSR